MVSIKLVSGVLVHRLTYWCSYPRVFRFVRRERAKQPTRRFLSIRSQQEPILPLESMRRRRNEDMNEENDLDPI
jgi:hypothetical protein